MSQLEISRMLTVSTGHLERETAAAMEYHQLQEVVYYDKEAAGWWVYCGDFSNAPQSPELQKLIELARKNDCLWLCLDRDGPVIEELPTFDW